MAVKSLALMEKIDKMIKGFQYQVDRERSSVATKRNQIAQLNKAIDKLELDIAGYEIAMMKLKEHKQELIDNPTGEWEVS